jgi:hypothetical protein
MSTYTAEIATVETYRLRASNGRHIRMATRVRFPNGQVVSFLDKMPKREAIRQAVYTVTEEM